MKKRIAGKFYAALVLLALFALWTAAVRVVDLQPIGPEGSVVGLAGINGAFHRLTDVHMGLYTLTDWLGLVPLVFVLGFAMLGLVQWVKRKSLLKVDTGIFLLGGFYVVTLAAYLLFEEIVVNYRPVLIDGFLEASYPSSTTLLVMCVMPTAAKQLALRIKKPAFRRWIVAGIWGFVAFMVAGRLLSGVHWLTDIIGGALLSAGLVMLYDAALAATEGTRG